MQFWLKIWDPWTLLHTYRLGLMCRWGVSYPKWRFLCFWSTDLKSSNRIKISWFIQVLFNFYWFMGSPLGGDRVAGWLNGDSGMMWGWQGWCGDDRDNMGMTGMTWVCQGRWGRHHYHDKHVGSHLQFLYMCVCMHACVYMHVCACAHVWGHPHVPRHPPSTCPFPRATGSPKHQNSISLELIEIIWFCLKILYLWTFLNSYKWSPQTSKTHLPQPPELRKPESKELQ